ncbi:hypothetical protein JZ751_017513 [Albula glossodonta]|uniref:C2H2-type domain-containing protein n=1 Tax=Albula glossodonta TaxID=121402 RepID=A0A8T2PP14_9TELE|nr:hypothetical protein JZ751_017513 [Albula glossodonta]
MAEPRFNNPYFWPPPPAMPGQLDNLVLINKIKEQLMAEKIRPPHLPPTSLPSQQPLLVSPSEAGQHGMPGPKVPQVQGLQSHSPSQPDIALHARPASSSVSQSRLGGAPSPNVISGLASGPGMEPIKSSGGLAGMLGPPPKMERGRKKIKAENPSGPLLVVPYPILASGTDQSCIGIPVKEGKTYRCKVCPLTFFSKSDMQIHSKSHTEAKPHKCPHCSKSFANASYLAQHLRIHLGVKPYHCSYCEKQHNKDKPYKCPNCYRAYSDSASLQIHLSAHAVKNAKAYCCSICGRAYTSETYLMKHMSKHTVVEHLVSHHSPQRTDSPSVPIRISLI